MALITKERKSLSIKILYYHVQIALHWTQECRSKWGKPKHTYTSNALQTEIRGLGQSSTNSCGAGADLGGGCRGCAPLPEMICGFLIQLMFTSGHHSVTPFLNLLLKKNSGSAPAFGLSTFSVACSNRVCEGHFNLLYNEDFLS